jgi:NDP-sugar pyrophosphorylase family protein
MRVSVLVAKVIRRASATTSYMIAIARLWWLRLKYPRLRFSGRVVISAGCRIVCTDMGSMLLSNVIVGQGTTLVADHGGTLEICDTTIGPYSTIVARDRISIMGECAIAEMVVIRDQNHEMIEGMSLSASGFSSAPISIGKGVWIGAKATILAGVDIEDGAAIGANAVVTTSVSRNAVVGGVPARCLHR